MELTEKELILTKSLVLCTFLRYNIQYDAQESLQGSHLNLHRAR